MQLKYNNEIKSEVITLELETTSFTRKENIALDKIGDPVILFEKVYGSGKFPVSVNKRMRSSFKIRIRFDGKEDLAAAANAANEFLDDIRELLQETMIEVLEKAAILELDFKPGNGYYDIT